MQFRQFTASVLLACAVAVFAAPAPMSQRDVYQDIKVRSWDAYNVDDVANIYRAGVLGARALTKPGAGPAAKPAVVPKPVAVPKTKPNAAPPKPKSPTPKTLSAPKPNTAPAPRPNTPPASRPNTQPAQKPTVDQCGAKSNGKNKRAFSTTCKSNTLTINGVTRTITKVESQGHSAVTYKVEGGWPDIKGQLVDAYAKTGLRPGTVFADEAKWLKNTDQLLAEGIYDGHSFIVFRGVTGKIHLAATNFFAIQLAPVVMGRANLARCEALVKEKLELVIQQVKQYVTQYGILHTDIQPGNILWDTAATAPTLIDWGSAKDVGVGQWSAKIEKDVRDQAVFSHLQGEEKLCGLE